MANKQNLSNVPVGACNKICRNLRFTAAPPPTQTLVRNRMELLRRKDSTKEGRLDIYDGSKHYHYIYSAAILTGNLFTDSDWCAETALLHFYSAGSK